jgi:hypothetical protein
MFPSAINLHKFLLAMFEADDFLPIQTKTRV